MLFSVIVGKLTITFLRLLGRKGSALPGLLVEKLRPGFLQQSLSRLPDGVIVVTGTNGKTTVTKIISELLEAQGKTVITNATGSNFVRGVITVICNQMTWRGQLSGDIAVLEIDEAHAVQFVEFYQPTGVVALNVLRDQLDRFGEIDTTAQMIGKVVHSSKEWVVLNANDPRIAALESVVGDATLSWFGYGSTVIEHFKNDDQHHSSVQQYFQAHKPDVLLDSFEDGKVTVRAHDEKVTSHLQLQGVHNAQNCVAAIAAVQCLMPNNSLQDSMQGLDTVLPAFGRGEVITLDNGGLLTLQLVKNPSGFTHNILQIEHKDFDVIGIAINDDFADSRDVSWLWDVDFRPLQKHKLSILCGGTRATDMVLRLKYDDVVSTVANEKLEAFLQQISTKTTNDSIIFCTYTAMLRLRHLVKRHSRHIREVKL